MIIPAALLLAATWEPMDVVATAYCPCRICCGSRAAGLTSTNVRVRDEPYGVAVDPDAIPYGTIIWVPPGEGYLDRSRTDDDGRQFTADDTGGAIRSNTRRTGTPHIDLRFRTHWSAKHFGRKRITIYLWRP